MLNRLIYGFHPYGFPDSGMPDTIARITRDDLREFHRQYFAPNNAILAIVGDVDGGGSDRGGRRASSATGSDRRCRRRRCRSRRSRPVAVVVIDKPDSVQTAVRIGQLGVPRKTPDYMEHATRRSEFSAAKAAIGCIACCAPSAA